MNKKRRERYRTDLKFRKICNEGHYKWYKKNQERVRKYKKEWRRQNREKFNAQTRKYYKEHPEILQEKMKRYRKKHPEKVNNWIKNHPEKKAEYNHKRNQRGFISLMDNPFPSNIIIEYHHIYPNLPFVIPIPKSIHKKYCGNRSTLKKHFDYNEQWIESYFELNINNIIFDIRN